MHIEFDELNLLNDVPWIKFAKIKYDAKLVDLYPLLGLGSEIYLSRKNKQACSHGISVLSPACNTAP